MSDIVVVIFIGSAAFTFVFIGFLAGYLFPKAILKVQKAELETLLKFKEEDEEVSASIDEDKLKAIQDKLGEALTERVISGDRVRRGF